MSLALLILILSISSLTVRADDDSVWPVGKICGITFGCIFIVIAVLAFLFCYRAWIRSKHDKMFSNFKDTTTHAPVETAPLPPALPPQSEPPPIYNLEYGQTFNTPDSFFNPQSPPHPLGITQLSYYPPLSGYIQENPMTITQPYSCQTERTNAVMAAAPLASLESLPHEDLSDSSVYRRFFSPEAAISPISSSNSPLSPLSSPPQTHQPESTRGTRKFSLAFLGNAARMFKFSNRSDRTGQQEGTITPEDGTRTSSSLPQPPENVGSQTRLFKQQKKPTRISVGGGGMSSGSRIGRKSKNSTSSQDTGHCNSLEITEIREMESSIDNDRFLHSLESAVFSSSATLTRGANDGGTSHHSSSSTLNDGDLGEFGGHSVGGSLYPPLPPGSPVIGFAYLGLGDVQEEDDLVQRIDEKGSREGTDPRGSTSTVGTDLARVGTPPLSDKIRFCDRNQNIGQHERNQKHQYSPDSQISAIAMLPTSRGQKQSLSASYTEPRPFSTNMEPWLVVSDEHLLISPTEEGTSRSWERGGHPMRSVSSNDIAMK